MLILASASPRRQELLGMITRDFTVKVSQVDESAITAPNPAALAQALGREKCLAVSRENPGALVLGCDTVVEFQGQVFGKPRDKEDARRMLTALSGQTHLVHTGVCLARDGRILSRVETSQVDFLPIDREDLEAYLDTPEPYDKAGGYAIQGHAALWCSAIRGTYFNIMGLPVCLVGQMLKHFEEEAAF